MPIRFDHLAYLVKDTARSVEAFRPLFPRVVLMRKAHDQQLVYVTYMSTSDGKVVIELVEPFRTNTLLTNKLNREKQECVPYHICFEVDDFKTEYNLLRHLGWITLTRPFETFTDGIQAAHLFKAAAGIVEIASARPR